MKANAANECRRAARPHGFVICLAALALAAQAGELLYNGIELPDAWPPRREAKQGPDYSPTPYLANPPAVIPIDLGRQLFVDDFLVESMTNLVRVYNKPTKHVGNPVMWPQTDLELDKDPKRPYRQAPYAATVSGGLWWDPCRKVFRMWYESGWMKALSYAESKDGLSWERPQLDIVPGTNKLFARDRTDSWSVFPDYAAPNPYARWCMLVSPPGNPRANLLFVAEDGVHFKSIGTTGESDDRTTMFYNPFRRKWVYSLRGMGPHGFGRNRSYWESTEFGKDCFFSWHSQTERPQDASLPRSYPWLSTDKFDAGEPGGQATPQLYNVDAVAYESIMLSIFELHMGPENQECLKAGLPKITDLHFAYSRDGWHFTRPDRTPAIRASRWGSGKWDTGYIQPISNICVIQDERLWFYYSGIRGDSTAAGPLENHNWRKNGMHFYGSMGVATLRRDGFVGLVADGIGSVTTRPVRFDGKHLFVNAECRFGDLSAEVLDESGNAIPGFAAADCSAFRGADSTKVELGWKGGDLSSLAGKTVRFRFNLHCGTLYSFWVSKDASGKSGGYLAGGGPAYAGLRDI